MNISLIEKIANILIIAGAIPLLPHIVANLIQANGVQQLQALKLVETIDIIILDDIAHQPSMGKFHAGRRCKKNISLHLRDDTLRRGSLLRICGPDIILRLPYRACTGGETHHHDQANKRSHVTSAVRGMTHSIEVFSVSSSINCHRHYLK